MNPRVDFYFIPDNPLLYACRIVQKAYQNKRSVFVYMKSAEDAKTLDDLLWTFNDISFIPHEIFSVSTNTSCSIQLSWVKPPEDQNDVMLNLTDSAPDFYSKFNRIIEIRLGVPANTSAEEDICKKFYQERKLEIITHSLA